MSSYFSSRLGSLVCSQVYFCFCYSLHCQLASRGDTVMRALYDFVPQGSGEIQLEVGQVRDQTCA